MGDKISILCLSDTELSKEELSPIVSSVLIKFRDVDMIVHLGDGVSNFVQISKTLGARPPIYIKGNHDPKLDLAEPQKKIIIRNVSFYFYHGISSNPIYEHFDVLKNKIRFRLGLKINLNWYYRNQATNLKGKYDVVVYGHTHIPRIAIIGETAFFCPGAISKKSFSRKSPLSCGMIELSSSRSINTLNLKIYRIYRSKDKISIKLAQSKRYERPFK